jgi:hypothetical protein
MLPDLMCEVRRTNHIEDNKIGLAVCRGSLDRSANAWTIHVGLL